MNYYERHIGDYLKDTSHLSLLEHGVYTRLLDVYYTREGGIPQADAARLICARSKDERGALQAVLGEFFVLVDGLHIQARAQREIGKFSERQVDSDDRRDNDKERQRRARERRKHLFAQLRCHDIVPKFDTKTGELESMLSRVTSSDESRTVTRDESRTVTRDNTATHTPYPIPNKENTPPSGPPLPASRPTPKGSRLPSEWEPGETGVAFAEQQGLRNGRASTELAKFRDYWAAQPGQKGVKADWQATWRNWVRKAAESPAPRGSSATDLDDMFRRGTA